MNGSDLKAWRKRNGYKSQDHLRIELGIKSRATISGWENCKEELPRMLQLSLYALELSPELRKADSGKRFSVHEHLAIKRSSAEYIAKRKLDLDEFKRNCRGKR